jgi:hypothetical protein
MNFEWEAVAPSAAENALYAQFGDSLNSIAQVLLGVYQLRGEKPVAKRLMKYHHIRESIRSHMTQVQGLDRERLVAAFEPCLQILCLLYRSCVLFLEVNRQVSSSVKILLSVSEGKP